MYYYIDILKAYLIGSLKIRNHETYIKKNYPILFSKTVSEETILKIAKSESLNNLYYFKKNKSLPRIDRVLGILKNIQPKSLLDIGPGRGVFLLPLLNAFPDLPITSIDILDHRVDMIKKISEGGYKNLTALKMDVKCLEFEDKFFEITTALEVLEHIEDYKSAIKEIIRVTTKYIIISVPSNKDNNPEHINFFSNLEMKEIFSEFGLKKIKNLNVANHSIFIVSLFNE